jgi:hypothetical protein
MTVAASARAAADSLSHPSLSDRVPLTDQAMWHHALIVVLFRTLWFAYTAAITKMVRRGREEGQ